MRNDDGPVFLSIRETAKTGIINEYSLRRFLAMGLLPGFFAGNKFMVNTALLYEQIADPDSPFNAGAGRREERT